MGVGLMSREISSSLCIHSPCKEIHSWQMPKVKFKRNIRNMLLQKLSEVNECIDLLDLNMT